MPINSRTGEIILRFDIQISNAAREGDNDRCLELVRDQKQWYEFFGYGTFEERREYYRRVEDSAEKLRKAHS